MSFNIPLNRKINKTKDNLIQKIARLQNKLTTFPRINFGFLSIVEKKIEGFFQAIEKRIIFYKTLKEEEKQKVIIRTLEKAWNKTIQRSRRKKTQI